MKNALLLLAGATALSLASCSQEKTAETTTTTTLPADGAATTTTVSDATYKSRGTRMADKFATDMKISDEATKEKLRTAYYNRSKRYDELAAKYKADTAGYAAARRDYNKATDQEFQSILVVPAQYSSYQSSRSTYDEANNLDTADQTAAASSATMPSDSSSTTTTSTTTTEETPGSMSGAGVAKGKSKLTDGTKVKVKTDGTVKVKDAAGNKTKM
ncbi:MAG: hypothetical protein ACRYG7_50320 [Janthinobacterium lividum]